ncbi:MAG: aminotransferase class V-fold PLP-dependent enzyme [Gammaproteobacteria bacterium]|nr:aminotransferase class V-fold PLP-dependent enzyme [Gammaproteobacteria bacterium]
MSAANEWLYLDYAATTPLDPNVAERMREVRQTSFANPASNHAAGRLSATVVDQAGVQLAELLNTDPGRFLWTSGATESNNLAITGVAKQRSHLGRHLVTMRTEHKAVVDVFRALEKQGFDVSWLLPDADGQLSVEQFEAALRDDTQLVSIMHVNNETGCFQDIATLGGICRTRGITFHVDGAQAAGKVPVDLEALPVDLYSMTAHKFYGPKGVGALYIADGTVIEPLMFGGGQQRRLRPGTLAVELIAGLGAAAAESASRLETDLLHLTALKQQLLLGIETIEGVCVNGPKSGAYPGILNVSVADIEGESLLLALEPLCVATGSACNSQSQEPSYVLRALGRSDMEAQSAVRFSLGRPTSKADIARAIDLYRAAVVKLRSIAPGHTT